jgi:hypothetical protein
MEVGCKMLLKSSDRPRRRVGRLEPPPPLESPPPTGAKIGRVMQNLCFVLLVRFPPCFAIHSHLELKQRVMHIVAVELKLNADGIWQHLVLYLSF